MPLLKKAYMEGVEEVLNKYCSRREVRLTPAYTVPSFEKKASIFNFSDSNDSGGLHLSNFAIPAIAALLAGTVGYMARDKGNGKSAVNDVKNFIGGTARNLVRRVKPRPFYDINAYI